MKIIIAIMAVAIIVLVMSVLCHPRQEEIAGKHIIFIESFGSANTFVLVRVSPRENEVGSSLLATLFTPISF